jgi:3-phosphoshikimate 1-carboxyvinyltransferase
MVFQMIQKFENVPDINGVLNLPGDKSISHRAVMFGALADGISVIKNCSQAEDVVSTMSCFEKMGVKFEHGNDEIKIYGKGFKGLTPPEGALYAGNSGTTARLISGVLCAQDFESTLTGDESLSSRPMSRVVEPLKQMGACFEPSEKVTLPLRIIPAEKLQAVNYKLQVASAQVKSAMLLAGLFIEDETVIIEPIATRNHTEKMLGLKTEQEDDGKKIFVSKNNYPKPFAMTIPSDISSAAFFIILALLTKGSEILIKHVTLNETRTGFLQLVKDMGGRILVEDEHEENGERRGDIRVFSSRLTNIEIPEYIIPNIIDEIPILSVAGVFAKGKFVVRNAKELRVKESDRIKSMCLNFKMMGLHVTEYEDGFEVDGNIIGTNFTFESFGDHRIAMAFAVMSMLLPNGGTINGFEAVAISNPSFLKQLNKII